MTTIEKLPPTGAAWVQTAKGSKFHLVEDGADTTTCGKSITVPEDLRERLNPNRCFNCLDKGKGTDVMQIAEARLDAYEAEAERVSRVKLDHQRAGKLRVFICSRCGQQLFNVYNQGHGSLYCHSEAGGFHQSVIEELEVQGPVWQDPHKVEMFSSRTCEWGVNGCTVQHEKPDFADEAEQEELEHGNGPY